MLTDEQDLAQSKAKTFMDELAAKYKEKEILQDLEKKHAIALNQERMGRGIGLGRAGSAGTKQYAPSNIGKLLKEQESIIEKYGPNSPQAAIMQAAIDKSNFIKKGLGGGNAPGSQNVEQENRFSKIPGSYSLNGMPAGDVNKTKAEMRADINKSTQIIEGARLLDDLEKLINEHPNLSESFAKGMESPNEGWFDSVKKVFTKQKDRAALEKFRKITSELVQKGAMAFGGKTFTDARQRLIEQSKASSGLTDEANRYVINNMRHIFDKNKGIAQKNATKQGLSYNYYVPYDPDVFSDSSESVSEEYSDSDILETAKKYGMTPEEVRQELGI